MIDDTQATGRSAEYHDGLTTDAAGATTPTDDHVSPDETGDLISADKVVGTAVYHDSGERIGTIDSVMLHKRSGKVAYAVMSFGGFLGIGERYHPLPWDALSYDLDKDGYRVAASTENLKSAPSYSRAELDRADYGREVDTYYGDATARAGVATQL